MKLEVKAYKCTFPNLFIDAYTRHMWNDPKQYYVIYGKNQKEAIKEYCCNHDMYSYWELKSNINTRRFKEMDFYSQEISEELKPLSKDQVRHLTHSLGVEIGGYFPEDFYRNYSLYYEKNEECEVLVKLGLMGNYKKLDSEVYFVTDVGIKAVKTLLLIRKPLKKTAL